MRLIAFLLFILCVCLGIELYNWHRNIPDLILGAIDKNAVLSDMRNAKIDCERLIPRTQECLLIYEYLPVSKQ